MSFQNINITGVGVFDNQSGTTVSFRGVASANGFLTVTLDAGNHVALFTIDINALAAALPAATTTQTGVLETATDAEALAKVATDKIVTPSNFAAMASSATFAGLVELATDAEAITGTSTTLALTPANLTAVLSTLSLPTVWADAATRAGATPDFVGQLGTQQDTFIPYVASGLAVGDFDTPLFALDNTNNAITAATTLNLGGQTLTFGAGNVSFTTGVFNFNDGSIRFGDNASCDVDFGANSNIQIGGVTATGASVFSTGAAGAIQTTLISTFVSLANVQAGYTAFANPATIRTCDTAAVTLQQLAQLVGTLVEDLKAVLLPAT